MLSIEDDAGLAALVRPETGAKIAGGFTFTEGPVWVPADGCLLFSDIPNDTIHRWRPGADAAEVYRSPSRQSNGLTLDRAGNLLACEHAGRRLSRAPYGGGGPGTPADTAESLAETWAGRRLNSPNDAVVHSTGAIYFTDPTYGLPDARLGGDLPHRGVYRLDPDGTLGLDCLDVSFHQPNGLAFSPDESVLYVADSHDKVVRRFGVKDDGTLEGGDRFVDMRPDRRRGGPDGMKVDEDGRLWTTGAGGVWVVEPDGRVLGVLTVPEVATNLAFGGPAFADLFVTAHTGVYRVATAVRGVAPGSRA